MRLRTRLSNSAARGWARARLGTRAAGPRLATAYGRPAARELLQFVVAHHKVVVARPQAVGRELVAATAAALGASAARRALLAQHARAALAARGHPELLPGGDEVVEHLAAARAHKGARRHGHAQREAVAQPHGAERARRAGAVAVPAARLVAHLAPALARRGQVAQAERVAAARADERRPAAQVEQVAARRVDVEDDVAAVAAARWQLKVVVGRATQLGPVAAPRQRDDGAVAARARAARDLGLVKVQVCARRESGRWRGERAWERSGRARLSLSTVFGLAERRLPPLPAADLPPRPRPSSDLPPRPAGDLPMPPRPASSCGGGLRSATEQSRAQHVSPCRMDGLAKKVCELVISARWNMFGSIFCMLLKEMLEGA